MPNVKAIAVVIVCSVVAVAFGPEALVVWLTVGGGVVAIVALYRAINHRDLGRAALFAAALSVVSWVLVLSPGAAFSSRRLEPMGFEGVRPGMSLPEVAELMGGPPGNYGAYSQQDVQMTAEGSLCQRWHNRIDFYWTDDRQRLEVCFDRSGRVLHHHRRIGYQQSFTLAGRIGRLFGPQ